MKRFFTVALLIVLTVPLTGGLVASAQNADDLKIAIDQKAKQLEEVTKKIEETQQDLTVEVVRGKTLKQEVTRIDETVKKVNVGIQVSEITLEKLTLEIQMIQQEIDAKERSADLKRQTVSRLLQDYQQRERESVLLGFLSGRSLAQSLAAEQSISDINDGLLQEVQELKLLKAELDDRLGQLSGKKKSVESERETLKVRKAIAADELVERQRLLAETKNREENYKKVLSELEKQQQAISDEIDEIETALRAQYGGGTLPMKRPGVLLRPIEGGRVTQLYGATKFAQRAYKSKFHNGIDFGVPQGTEVLAAEDGVVLLAGNNGRVQYGKYVLVKHANGLLTLYAHLSYQSVRTGDQVTRGQSIGRSGNTGYSTGPHLHFTVYFEPDSCDRVRKGRPECVQLQPIGSAGPVPVGFTINPSDYL